MRELNNVDMAATAETSDWQNMNHREMVAILSIAGGVGQR